MNQVLLTVTLDFIEKEFIVTLKFVVLVYFLL